jgi:signal transduction histidine kinase
MSLVGRILDWRRGFSGRIFSGLLLAMLFMVIILNLVFINLQKKLLTSQVVEAGANQVGLLAYTIRLGVFTENIEQLQAAVDVVSHRQGVTGVFVFDRYGHKLYASQRPGSIIPEKTSAVQLVTSRDRPDREQAGVEIYADYFSFWAPVVILTPSSSLGDFYPYEENREPQKEVIGSVQIITDKESLHQGLKAVVYRGLLLTFIFIILTMLVTFLVARQASGPIEDLLLKVRKMTGVKEQDSEIDLLNQTFLDLVEDLHDSFRTINELKLNLEKKIAGRTAELSLRHRALSETNLQLTTALTELRNTQSRLVQSEKMASLGQLVAGVAHEINNTTNFISGAMPSLKRLIGEIKTIVAGCESTVTSQDYEIEIKKLKKEGMNCRMLLNDVDVLLANISEGARRTGEIVRQLRDFSRPDEAFSKDVDINSSLDSALTFALPEYKDRITVERNYDRQLPLVTCMPGKINQVFLNLLLNAMQAISDHGTVTIKTRQQNKKIHVLIKDSGCGISAGDLENIFNPFFTRKESGIGLGLSISYAVIAEHGGEILVESTKGKGTEFEVVLPVSPRQGSD